MDEHFTCQACRTNAHIRCLHHRYTMPGDYCVTCAQLEICAACHEPEPVVTIGAQHSGRCMCWHCVTVLMYEGVNVRT